MATTIDVYDPLYVHPSDTPGLSLISERLTGSDNYGIWSRAMLIALCAKNKLVFIDGSSKRPPSASNILPHWERCNAIVLSWIMNSVSKELLGGIVYSTDTAVVWADLKERFDKINGSRIFSLHREIGRILQGNNTILVYFSKLRQLWDEYASLVPLPSCECESVRKYVEHDQQQRLLQFLMGLNDSYAHIRSQILIMTPLPTVSQAFTIIAQEETHRSLMIYVPSVMDSGSSAFYSSQSRNDDKRRSSIRCEYRDFPGHSKSNCFRLIGYPVGHRLYGKGQIKSQSQRSTKNTKPMASVNMLDTTSIPDTSLNVSSAGSGSTIFTPEQYAEILKLLTRDRSSNVSNTVPTVNMAGPVEWEDSGDW